MTRDLTADNFKRTVDGNDDVLVYLWAPLCAPRELIAREHRDAPVR